MTRIDSRQALLAAGCLFSFLFLSALGCGSVDAYGSSVEPADGSGEGSINIHLDYGTENEEIIEGDGNNEPVPDDKDALVEEGDSSEGGAGETNYQDIQSSFIPVVSPEALFCDYPLYEGEEWIEVEKGELVYRFLPATAAERDLERIDAARQLVYNQIVDFLGLSVRPRITIVLSPSRMAARHHGYGVGRAIKSASRIEVLWPEGEGSYEREMPGHEIAHILATHVDGKLARLSFLDEGLAEFFDGSGRDLHRAYVDKLMAGQETGFPTRMDDWDAWGMNYGRAGSFVAFLIERYGKERFLKLWLAAATTGGWAQVTTLGDSVEDGQSLEIALDSLLRQSHGVGFDAVRLAWESKLQPYFESPPAPVSDEDLIEMLSLVAAADRAIANSDAVAFRATLEGFYCDNWTDDEKAELSREVVLAYDKVDTVVISAFPVGIRNYQEVLLHTVRREMRRGEEEILRTGMLWMERFPEGWRISWSTVW